MLHRNRDSNERGDTLVLCYHAVEEDWDARFSITPATLRRHVEFLLRRGYRLTTFGEAVSSPTDRKTAAITFDDGFRSVAEQALGLLSEVGVVATVFVPTAFIDSGGSPSWEGLSDWIGTDHEAKMLPLSQSELVELAERGWEIGSHTCTHPHLSRLAADDLARELAESRRRCSELMGRPCVSLAYPYGDADERVRLAAATAGYHYACTLPRRFRDPSPLMWPRVGVWHGDTGRTFALKVSPAFRRLRRSSLWALLADSRVAARRLGPM